MKQIRLYFVTNRSFGSCLVYHSIPTIIPSTPAGPGSAMLFTSGLRIFFLSGGWSCVNAFIDVSARFDHSEVGPLC